MLRITYRGGDHYLILKMEVEKRPKLSKNIVYVTKRMQLSSAHRLYSPQLSDEENKSLFGKCFGVHGHNYVVKVTLRGPVDPVTGMLINVVDLKHAMQESFFKAMDHKNLEQDIPYFQDKPSTGENIAVYVWESLGVALGEKAGLLYEVTIEETENNTFTYRGETC